MELLRATSEHPHFIQLVKLLDAYLAEIDGPEHLFYAQLNAAAVMPHVVIAYENETPVGCGALREFDSETFEIKRMYTSPEARGKGIATQILQELESWSGELGSKRCVLETGHRQPDAISLYEKNSYTRIPNYGKYNGVYNSLCYEKILNAVTNWK